MSMRNDSTMLLPMQGSDARTHESVVVDLRALPSSLRPNLFSGD
jgi:hypothetical protein